MKRTVFCIVLAVLMAFGLCACTPKEPIDNTPAPTDASTEAPSDATPDPDSPKVLGCEERVLGGEAVKLDIADLKAPGVALDIDGDGTKEIVTAEPNDFRPDVLLAVFVNGEKTRVLPAEGEFLLVSLFGDSIQLAEMGEVTFEYDKIKYRSDGGTGEEPSPRPACIVSCFIESRDYWTQNGTKLVIPCEDASKLPRYSTIEEYLRDGAQAELLFPPMVGIDENHDLNYRIDLDNDGEPEELRLSGGRVLVYEKGSRDEPVYELPYPIDDEGEEGSFALIAEYSAQGYDCVVTEDVRIFVNGTEAAPDPSVSLYYGSDRIFFADPDTKLIKLANGDSDTGWIIFGYDAGSPDFSVVTNPYFD